uniref:CHAD domain-containing protein n=1 Tax=Globodera pallida TaxID=36090 RepID=A0A183BX44_GLOPA
MEIQEETLCQEIIAKSRKEPSIKENQTNQAINNVLNLRNQLITFKWIVKKFPKNKLIKMSKRRLNEPVFRAISLCKQAMECVSQSDWKSRKAHLGELMAKIHSIISGLRTEFGTLVVEVELQFFNENDLTLRNKQILEQQLDKITAFLHKNKTYCAMEYFGLAKAALGNVPNANDTEKRADFKIYHIIQNLVMDAKSEWLLIGRVNFYWGDRDKMLSYSNKAKKLVETANELFGPLKQVVVQFLDHQISKAKNGKVAEVKEAANELANSFNNLQKVREKIKELRRLLKKEKRSFEGPYQLLFT